MKNISKKREIELLTELLESNSCLSQIFSAEDFNAIKYNITNDLHILNDTRICNLELNMDRIENNVKILENRIKTLKNTNTDLEKEIFSKNVDYEKLIMELLLENSDHPTVYNWVNHTTILKTKLKHNIALSDEERAELLNKLN